MSHSAKWIKRLLAAVLMPLALAMGAAVWYLGHTGVTPARLAAYVSQRAAGHGGMVTFTGDLAATTLLALDRHTVEGADGLLLAVGASARPFPAPSGRLVPVANSDQLRAAIGAAAPGDVISLTAGTYRIGATIAVSVPGTAANPITVRADSPGAAMIEFDTVEGFAVAAPYWHFENLTLRGVCADHSSCEHAFHVTGSANHFVAQNNTIADFNAHFKINGVGGRFPDNGRIEANTLDNRVPRNTSNSVTPIDLVGASNWTIRRNLIADFVKQGGDQVSYGAFAKGGGSKNLFEQNIIWCERRLQGQPGQRVGLSLGGGGSAPVYCRDRACITEQSEGVVRSNLIASCSDAGIYLNSAAGSTVAHNTLLGTAGAEVRYPTSSATFEGNLVDGAIRSRNDGIVHNHDNLDSASAWQFAGRRPLRQLFVAQAGNPLSWAGATPRRQAGSAAPADLCGAPKPRAPAYGAFEDFSACVSGP